MAQLLREEVERIARLARLRLGAEEAEALAGQLDAILAYVEKLDEVDASDVEPTSHVIPFATPLREDEPRPSLDPELALRGAPARVGSAFAVPKVVDDEAEG
jgi:aspartyl-tRNA(Asn)/glutamyl-tRNA(Gln) amidotransferase subunit C